MSKSKIRVGIVGAGGVGGLGGRNNSHAGGYRRCEEVELAAIADINLMNACNSSAMNGKLHRSTVTPPRRRCTRKRIWTS